MEFYDGGERVSDIDYQKMIEHYDAFKEIQNQQKARGLNDFNVFTTLLKSSDEVRLHSRFIGALLNKQGLHYQGTLFLDKFLEQFKPDNFDFDAQSSRCSIERENKIDIYLTDGINHIIIENKVYTGDQKNQIQRYIDHIKKENKDIDGNNIWVIYLSLGRAEPSKYSLGKYTINDDRTKLTHKEFSVHYSNIHYKQNSDESNKIMSWLDDCLKEIQNIKNLFVAISSYREVVEKISGTYESKVMSLENYLGRLNDVEKLTFITTVINANNDIMILKSKIVYSFLEKLEAGIQNDMKKPEQWDYSFNKKALGKAYNYPIRIYKSGNKMQVGFEFLKSGYKGFRFGVVRTKTSIDIRELCKEYDFSATLKDKNYKKVCNEHWLTHLDCPLEDLFIRIMKDGESATIRFFLDKFQTLLYDFYELCNMTNDENDKPISENS